MTAFKKNQEVFHICSWNNKGQFCIQHMTVMSCGKKQATLQSTEGKMLKCFVYANKYATEIFDAATTDAEAKALELAAGYISSQIELNTWKVGHAAYHQGAVQEQLEYFNTATPSFIWR